MECHKCEHHEAVEAGKYVGVTFELTPCSKCDLQEVSIRTIEVDGDRPVYVPGRPVSYTHLTLPTNREV